MASRKQATRCTRDDMAMGDAQSTHPISNSHALNSGVSRKLSNYLSAAMACRKPNLRLPLDCRSLAFPY
jgi:hypothetical protein